MESAFHGHGGQHRWPVGGARLQNLHGLIPATVVPMTETGDLDMAGLRRYLRWVADQGPLALAVTADTAEVVHLTHDEQLRVVEVAKDTTGLLCIAGLTGSSTARAVDRATDLRDAGAEALLVFPRPGFAGAPPHVVLDYHRAVGEVGLPLVAFQLQPALGGVRYPPDVLRQLLDLDSVVALKEASFDRDHFAAAAAAAAAAGKALLSGNDTFILESFELGAGGALLGFGAVKTAEQVAMIDAWRDGRAEEARAAAAALQPLADAVFAAPVGDYRARLKECLVLLGVIEAAHVRRPLLPVDDGERARLRRALRRAAEAVPA